MPSPAPTGPTLLATPVVSELLATRFGMLLCLVVPELLLGIERLPTHGAAVRGLLRFHACPSSQVGRRLGSLTLRVRRYSAKPLGPFHHLAIGERSATTMEEDPPNMQARLMDAQSRLCSIRELAVDQVLVAGTTEQRLADAEIRLMRIHDLATGTVIEVSEAQGIE